MDGVLVHEEQAIPGAQEFVGPARVGQALPRPDEQLDLHPRDLRPRLVASGIDVPEESLWTSALATAKFVADQRPSGGAFVVGEAGLLTAMHDVGFVMTDRHPDYVVLGETRTYSFESITRAIRLIENGARFIATNLTRVVRAPSAPCRPRGRSRHSSRRRPAASPTTSGSRTRS